MIVIPAVDIRNGNCVRLLQGKADAETIYSDSPLEMAKLWADSGAERLHIVDLDGAFDGKPANSEIILKIREELDICIEVGGGIRNEKSMELLLDAGIDKVILGTSVITDIDLLKAAVKRWPGRVIAGLDSVNGKIATRGWTNITDKDLVTTAQEISGLGIEELIITDIATDGMLTGPNLELMKNICAKVSSGIIASGGISSVEDIKALVNLKCNNLTGVITGKAIYDGRIDLKQAIELVKK